MTPTLSSFAEGRLCTADPFGRRGAVRRESPASPPRGGLATFVPRGFPLVRAALQES
jgi:hypothetical protein